MCSYAEKYYSSFERKSFYSRSRPFSLAKDGTFTRDFFEQSPSRTLSHIRTSLRSVICLYFGSPTRYFAVAECAWVITNNRIRSELCGIVYLQTRRIISEKVSTFYYYFFLNLSRTSIITCTKGKQTASFPNLKPNLLNPIAMIVCEKYV